MPLTTLPYVFSPLNAAGAGSFLQAFKASPETGKIIFPPVDGSASAFHSAAAVLGSAVRLMESGDAPPSGWQLMQCEPREIARAKEIFRFEDGVMPRFFGGAAAFENRLGQFVSVSWTRADEFELRTGSAWEGVTAMQSAVFSTVSENPPARVSYQLRFEDRALESLRSFLNVKPIGMATLLQKLADFVLASGLIVDAGIEDLTTVFDLGEASHWTPVRMDQYIVRFAKNPHISLIGATMVAGDGTERIRGENAGLYVGSPSLETPATLPQPLLNLWNYAEVLAMGRMRGTSGLA